MRSLKLLLRREVADTAKPAVSDVAPLPGKESASNLLLVKARRALLDGKTDAAVQLAAAALNNPSDLEKFKIVFAEAQKLDLLLPIIWEHRQTALRDLESVSHFMDMCFAEMPESVYSSSSAKMMLNRAKRKVSVIAASAGISGVLKRGDYYLRELREWMFNKTTPPVTFAHTNLIKRFVVSESNNERHTRDLLLFKYRGWDASTPEKFAKSLALTARRIEIPADLSDYLYRKQTNKELDFETWLDDAKASQVLLNVFKDAPIARTLIKNATGTDRIFLTGFCAGAEVEHHVDMTRAKLLFEGLDTSRGLLICTFHGGFANVLNWLTRHLLKDHYAVRLEPRRESGDMTVRHGSRGAAFRAAKTLMQKKVVMIGPDGPLFGDASASKIKVFGRSVEISAGAARIAYEASCDTGWCSVTRQNGLFVPFYVAGPKRAPDEKYGQFEQRWKNFYSEQIESALSSDPRSLALLSPLWSSLQSERGGRVKKAG